MKIIKRLLEHKKGLLFAALTYTLILVILCLVSSNKIPTVPKFVGIDKVFHFLAHFGLTFFWTLYFSSKYKSQNTSKAFLISLIVGLLIEWAQSEFTSTRSADFYDVVANVLGALSFLTMYKMVLKPILKK